MIVARSVLFNALFYLNLIILLVAAMATLTMPRWAVIAVARFWARGSLWMLRVICGIDVEWRGLEKIPRGAVIVAAKHQSLWETFALITIFPDPAFIVKRELMWIPGFGWCLWRGEMIPVDRGAGKQAMAVMNTRAREALEQGRQIIIFPEGTRRPPGAEPKYKYGIAHVYAEGGAPCVPIALNSGLFWPRRRFLRYPGTVRVEILDPIVPGLDREAFFGRLQRDIESATARLIVEGEQDVRRAISGAERG
ncbi:MAG: 1-acyl-sn-glycerol-3-phosphate acyltransferase [Bradyrhizobiaceae bacterium]|nr:1-acyl-sn-glycerol-3-phosphate acyltransferase [Bradyrhizobiaceae bacterium]